MRVLLVTNAFVGRRGWIAEQANSLRSLGVKIDVLFFQTERARFRYGLRIFDIARALRSQRYDVVHTHHSYTLMMVDAARALVGSRIPVVLTNHEGQILDRQRRARTWHPTSQLRYSLRLKRIAARRADFVIFVSRQLAELIDVDVPQDIIPCGVDLNRYRVMDRTECRQVLGLSLDATVVFFPGVRTDRYKNFELARAAHAAFKVKEPNSVLLAGGDIPSERMPIYYNSADIVLQTSFSEASPSIVKEALACEIPVVSTDVGDTREILEGVTGCAICRDDPLELAECMTQARGRRAEGARAHLLRKRLDLEQVAYRIARVYRELGEN